MMRSDQPEYDDARGFVIPIADRNQPGWAHRPSHGKLYGEKIDMEPWRATIREIFERGIRDKGAKQSASLILESLEKHYPFRMDIPGEIDINTEIQRLFRLQKEGRPLDTPAGRGMDKRYVATLREAIDQNLTKDETLD
ncbi:Hypothetical Protein FCC1311_118422, partial [Hondaea fermentalgiana]